MFGPALKKKSAYIQWDFYNRRVFNNRRIWKTEWEGRTNKYAISNSMEL